MKILYIFLAIVLIFEGSAFGEILFQDNFDNQGDWTRTQSTTSDDVCYSGCTGIPSGWTSYRNGFSYCTNGPGNNNFYIDAIPGYPVESSGTDRGGSGKCVTFWDESCTNQFEDSDGMIAKQLGANHDEIYIRFYIKFSPDFKWMDSSDAYAAGHSDTAQHKFWHIQHYCEDGGDPYSYFGARDRCNYPVAVGGIYRWTSSEKLKFYQLYACEESTCNAGTPAFDTYTEYITIGDISTLRQDGNLLDGNWHSIEQHYKMNTNAGSTFNTDGVWEIWIDENLIFSRSDIPWSNDGSQQSPRRGWNFIVLGGNNNNRWTAVCSGTACEQWYAIDDVVISTEYIGIRPSPPKNLKIQ